MYITRCVLAPLAFCLLLASPSLNAKTEILWDSWGVPHIYSDHDEGLFYAHGWALMQNHADLVLKLYGEARGRAAEYWGEEYSSSDLWIRKNGIPARAEDWYKRQKPGFRKCLDAFARGINDQAKVMSAAIDPRVRIVLPVTGVDVMAHAHRIIHFQFVASPALMALGADGEDKGSNAWAISAGRSASKKAMLLSNPHLPWSDFFLFHEAHLVRGKSSISGVSLVGFPVLGIAFNDHLGWTHTVNIQDGVDLFDLELQGNGYLFDNKVRDFEIEEQVHKIKQRDGTVKEELLLIKKSVHGPVIVEKGDRAIAIRVVGLDRPFFLQQWWDMARARSFNEFERALKSQQLPVFNVLYADVKGSIFYTFGGLTPERVGGAFSDWSGVVPGTSSSNLWKRPLRYEKIPKLKNPKTGWLQNANDPPWTCTIPMPFEKRDFPPYLSITDFPFRPQRSARLLMEDSSISFEEVIGYKHSTHMEAADRILDDLIPAVRKQGTELAKQAADVLEQWDRTADQHSNGTLLFTLWATQMGGNLFAVPFDEKNPMTTPDGLADPQKAVAALDTAAKMILSSFGKLEVPWGAIVRLRAAGHDLPGNGTTGDFGVFRPVSFTTDPDGKQRITGGDTYINVVEFGKPVRAKASLVYGNASQKGSRHAWDQLSLFQKKELREVWRDRGEIKKNMERYELLQP